jgi:hypothetical protein
VYIVVDRDDGSVILHCDGSVAVHDDGVLIIMVLIMALIITMA